MYVAVSKILGNTKLILSTPERFAIKANKMMVSNGSICRHVTISLTIKLEVTLGTKKTLLLQLSSVKTENGRT